MRSLAFVAIAAACLGLDTVRADEITVAVAANFARPMAALVERFEAETGHRVRVATGSTGGHYAQILGGAPFDVFFAADAERPRRLEEAGAAVPGSRFTYARGRLALWSRRDGYVDAEGRVLETADFRRLAIAHPELAPYGAAARDVLEALGLWEALDRRIVRGQDVGQVFGFVRSGAAELGFVAYAQLVAAGDELGGSSWRVPTSLHRPIEQQAVLLRDSPAARALLEFMRRGDVQRMIESFGYGD